MKLLFLFISLAFVVSTNSKPMYDPTHLTTFDTTSTNNNNIAAVVEEEEDSNNDEGSTDDIAAKKTEVAKTKSGSPEQVFLIYFQKLSDINKIIQVAISRIDIL